MHAYLVIDLKIQDPIIFAEYGRQVSPFIEKHGGEYLVRGGAHETLEGTWTPGRLVVIRFPSREAIHNFLNDPAYQDLKDLRLQGSTGNLVAVDGI